ncbi:helix-turn-helix domain-containing protein [Chryseobacterium tructae]|uniref:Winged helix-turn-helix transcriptional regulator n=1 Tax=Chryseobacterium tructae TaxID=1037380 RepID=A0ABV7XXS9_9FLAO|nr:helix-turn-helix domain-containing protein [Chryseobacterium tructae]MDN3692349.1 helix-turn-helix domain-containing protein [Chryseobacterium tructae]
MKNEIFICHNCPMTRTMATIGTKWKPIIIYTIGLKKKRFGQIFALMGIISKKVLTEQLKELVEDKIVIREEFNEMPPRVEYSLSEKGIELLAILNQLTLWNQKHQELEQHNEHS